MRILVTGGAGFIGSNFVRYLSTKTSYDILVYDKLTYAGRLENIHDLIEKKRVFFVRGDICDEELLHKTIKEFEPDAIVNFAAETHVDRSINEPAPFIKTNVLGLFTILETLKKVNRDVLLVHISTDEVYGDLHELNIEADENFPLNPSSPYSASKAAGDLLIRAYSRTYGLKYRIVRPCNNYGPYQHPEKLIPRTIIRLLYGKPAVIYGDGNQIRDWIHVWDTANAIHIVLLRGGNNEIYNVCRHNYASVREIVEFIAKIMGKDPKASIVYTRKRPGEDMRYAMKCDKVLELGWKPRYDLVNGLRETVEWYINNEWWWKPLLDETYVLSETPW